jgi:hypothetical protein
MGRDAGFAGAEDCVATIEAADGRAAAAGLAFVARHCRIVEIGATRPLQQVAAGRRHVAQLCRSAGKDRTGEQRVALLDQRMIRKVGIRHERADAQPAVRRLFDRGEREPRNVDQS